jgi:hypothetical protein
MRDRDRDRVARVPSHDTARRLDLRRFRIDRHRRSSYGSPAAERDREALAEDGDRLEVELHAVTGAERAQPFGLRRPR